MTRFPQNYKISHICNTCYGMKYKITIHFRDGHDEAYGVDYYSAVHCTLELFTFNEINTPQVIKIFPLLVYVAPI